MDKAIETAARIAREIVSFRHPRIRPHTSLGYKSAGTRSVHACLRSVAGGASTFSFPIGPRRARGRQGIGFEPVSLPTSLKGETRASRCGVRQHDGSGVKEGPGGVDAGLQLLASLLLRPSGKEPLDHPSARQNSKADLIRALGDDFDDDAGRGGERSPAYPPSAKTRSMKGNKRREACRSSPPPSRS